MSLTKNKPAPAVANSGTILESLDALCDQVTADMRRSCYGALCIGLRLIALHRAETPAKIGTGGFAAALDRLDTKIPRSTAYRWLNATAAVLCREFQCEDLEEVELPAWGSHEWQKTEALLQRESAGMSIRRLLVGSSATSDESRMDALISASETGDKDADEVLDQVARGELTLVQAIRAQGGKVQKTKSRNDPVYLTLDGRTGEPKGLFCKSLITLSNTFSRWDKLDETARSKSRAAWLALVAQLPKDLR